MVVENLFTLVCMYSESSCLPSDVHLQYVLRLVQDMTWQLISSRSSCHFFSLLQVVPLVA